VKVNVVAIKQKLQTRPKKVSVVKVNVVAQSELTLSS
jgi:hypothetical protein